jgi:AraC-like DNA-binding protein
MISLQYEAPDARLAPFVSSFYLFTYAGNALSELERADRAQFRFTLYGNGRYRFSSGRVDEICPVTIIGPTTAACTALADEPIGIFGWGMTPTGWVALMGSGAGEWVDRTLDCRQIFGDSIMDLRTRLIEAKEPAEQFHIGQTAATEIFRRAAKSPFEFTSIVDAWLLNDDNPDIEQLVADTRLSQRQLERMTKRYYGMPPKKLARKYRAVRAAHLLAKGDSLDDTALGLAFYDQSHLIREIKQFTGLTPTELKSGSSILTTATMQGRGSLTGQVSPLVSES